MNSSQSFSHTGSSNGGANGGQAQAAGATVSLRTVPDNIGEFKIQPLIGGLKLPLKYALR